MIFVSGQKSKANTSALCGVKEKWGKRLLSGSHQYNCIYARWLEFRPKIKY